MYENIISDCHPAYREVKIVYLSQMIYTMNIRCVFPVIPYIYFFSLIPGLLASEFALDHILFPQHPTKEVSSGHWSLEVMTPGKFPSASYPKKEYSVG